MTRSRHWPRQAFTDTCAVASTQLPFSLGGVIAGLRDASSDDPALVLVVEVSAEYCRVVVPPAVWPAARELLEIGQRAAVTGETDSHLFLHGHGRWQPRRAWWYGTTESLSVPCDKPGCPIRV